MATLTTTISYGEPAGSMVATLGAPGPAGQAATVTVGSTATGDPGSDASVVNVGTSSAAVLDFTIPRGVAGDQGPKGDQGDPGQPGVVYAVSPLFYDQPTQTLSIDLAGYATESWVTSQGYLTSSALTPYLTISSAASTYQPLSGMSSYLTKAGNLSGLTNLSTARDNLNLGSLNTPIFAGVTVQGSGTNVAQLTPTSLSLNHDGYGDFVIQPSSGITFPDNTVQTTAFTGTASVYWGSVLGDLSNQSDLVAALSAKYDASNPAGFITSAALAPYLTSATAASTYQTLSGMSSYLTTASAAATYRALTNTTFGYVFISAANQGYIYVNPNPAQFETTQGVYQSKGLLIRDASTNVPIARFEKDLVQIPPEGITFSDLTVQTSAGVSLSVLADYAQLAGATFTGKVNLATISASSPSVNLGGQCDSAPASATNGDLWISNAASPKLTYRTGGINYNLAVLNQFNTFTGQMVINTTSSTTAALRVTQLGTANAIEVEDSTSPDATRFVVDQNGNVGIGVATAYTSTAKLEVVGNAKASTFSNGTGPTFAVVQTSAHTGGSDTLDLIITVAGVNYRVGLRPA